jgi:hypothetical protein
MRCNARSDPLTVIDKRAIANPGRKDATYASHAPDGHPDPDTKV